MSVRQRVPGRKQWIPGWTRRVSALAFLAALAVGCGERTPDGPVELKFGHVGAPGSLFALSAEEFARRVNLRLPGQASVVVYGSSQLGGDEVLLQKIKLGTVDLALPSSVMSSRIEEFGLFEMPYVVEDREHMKKIEAELFWSELAPLAEREGYKIIAVWENGFRHITNNKRPVASPADLAGIKLRTPRGVWRVKLFQRFGANPTPMAFSEVFVALRTGAVDGQENPLAQIYASKLHEVQKYLSMSAHVYTPAYVTVSPSRWNRLPQTVREVLEQEAKAVQSFVYETAERLDRELLDKIRAAGVAVNDVDRLQFLEGSQAIYEEFGSEVEEGGALVARVLPLAFQ